MVAWHEELEKCAGESVRGGTVAGATAPERHAGAGRLLPSPAPKDATGGRARNASAQAERGPVEQAPGMGARTPGPPSLTDDLLAFLADARDEADRNEQPVVFDAAQDLINRLAAALSGDPRAWGSPPSADEDSPGGARPRSNS